MNGFYDPEELRYRLPVTEERQQLQTIFERIIETQRKAKRLLAAMSEVDALFTSIDRLPGIELIEPRSVADDHRFDRCGEYVFGHVLGESWCIPRTKYYGVDYVYNDTRYFLPSRRFRMVSADSRQAGDVVSYMSVHPVYGNEITAQFGICVDNGKIHSKFGIGPVFEHDVDMVPTSWAETAFFWRKVTH